MGPGVLESKPNGIVGQERFNSLGPLDETNTVTAEVVLIAEFKEFILALDPIGVEMVHGETFAVVFIDEGERRTAHLFRVDAKGGTHAADELGLSCSQFSEKGDDVTRPQGFR